jgi:hypothetical protein
MPVDLDLLHDAIVAGLRTKLADVTGLTVEDYPDVQRRVTLPAVLIELSEFEPNDDAGTGELDVWGHFEARCVFDPNAAGAQRAVRALAMQVANAANREQWGQPVSPAEILDVAEDGFKPDLDGYLVWRVEWRHKFTVGESIWTLPGVQPREIWLGVAPLIGPDHVADYRLVASLPEEPTL